MPYADRHVPRPACFVPWVCQGGLIDWVVWGEAKDGGTSWRHPLISRFPPGEIAGVNPTSQWGTASSSPRQCGAMRLLSQLWFDYLKSAS
ncbi:MAG: hypothetical protein JXB07_06660 [Anaerolineae bacterium]|nr:hypothetical protein [Anaerolineae bacterium]